MRLLPRLPIRILVMDAVAIPIALALPWSTSAVSILIAIWVVLLPLTIDPSGLLKTLRSPACASALSLFGLALLGLFWSESQWQNSLRGVSPVVKFLVLPLLVYHFERTKNGIYVIIAFFISCTILMLLSWLIVFDPQWTIKANVNRGLPIKDYIVQSQEFALCGVGAIFPALIFLRRKRYAIAGFLFAISFGFFMNLIFVIIARTAFVYIPVLILLAAWYGFERRLAILVTVVSITVLLIIGLASPNMRSKVASISTEYDQYRHQQVQTSIGERLEFWRKSFTFIQQAPFIGHGTGSAQTLFQGESNPANFEQQFIWNPHNQMLNVAIQWGLLGVLILVAMWCTHFALFIAPRLAAWFGILVVTQNILSSMFNSHLFDFTEGWIYVLGVGVAGGTVNAFKRSARVVN